MEVRHIAVRNWRKQRRQFRQLACSGQALGFRLNPMHQGNKDRDKALLLQQREPLRRENWWGSFSQNLCCDLLNCHWQAYFAFLGAGCNSHWFKTAISSCKQSLRLPFHLRTSVTHRKDRSIASMNRQCAVSQISVNLHQSIPLSAKQEPRSLANSLAGV